MFQLAIGSILLERCHPLYIKRFDVLINVIITIHGDDLDIVRPIFGIQVEGGLAMLDFDNCRNEIFLILALFAPNLIPWKRLLRHCWVHSFIPSTDLHEDLFGSTSFDVEPFRVVFGNKLCTCWLLKKVANHHLSSICLSLPIWQLRLTSTTIHCEQVKPRPTLFPSFSCSPFPLLIDYYAGESISLILFPSLTLFILGWVK